MTIVVYECDACNRSIERVQNKQGLDFIGRCVITDGCRGSLRQIGINRVQTTPAIPTPIIGLTEWTPRKALYTHTQTVLSDAWDIIHDLNTDPTVQIYTYNPEGLLVETVDAVVSVVNANQITVTFNQKTTGVVQCVARMSSQQQLFTILPTVDDVDATLPASVNQLLTIVVPQDTTVPVLASIQYIKNNAVISTSQIEFNDTLDNPQWNAVSRVSIQGKTYKVLTGLIENAQQNKQNTVCLLEFNNAQLHETSKMLITNYPFDTVDREFGKYISLLTSNTTTAVTQFTYKLDVMHCSSTYVIPVYPAIKVVS